MPPPLTPTPPVPGDETAATHTPSPGVTLIIKRNTLGSNKLFVPHLFLQEWPQKEADKDADDAAWEEASGRCNHTAASTCTLNFSPPRKIDMQLSGSKRSFLREADGTW